MNVACPEAKPVHLQIKTTLVVDLRVSAAIVVIAVAIFLFSGGTYVLVYRPPLGEADFTFIHPLLSRQFVAESLVVAVLYVLGSGGLALIYGSTKLACRPKEAWFMLITGATILLTAYFLLEALIYWKR